MKTQETAKRPRGRPATGKTPKRYFRMDDESWALVENAAHASGLTVSEWVRDKLLRAARREARQ